MAYTIVKSDGTVLTTIADGTINTTSTSLGLPGRNYAGYGQTLDTNFVHMMENFADTTPPSNPLRGQLWFDTNANTLYVCPADGTSNANAWLALTSTASGGTTTFGAVTVTGNLQANNITAISTITGANGAFTNISVSANANIATGNITTANISTLNTTVISTGSNTTAGTLTGTWTANGGSSGNTLVVTNGNIVASTGIKTDNYYYANGSPISFAGTYNNSNVAAYLPTYGGNILTVQTQATTITTGANTTAGTLTGNWTLSSGSRLQSTYADLAERFEADTYYDAGTVVELGGDKEITAVQYELSDDVFGVVSATAGYIMNGAAGSDETHPPIAVGGRVQVKVTGKVKRGQRLVSAGNGVARAAKPGEATAFNIIGRALEHKTTDELGAVEAFVKIN
jgi:Peptidase_G2, IMC autoproteolytic cleavage domain